MSKLIKKKSFKKIIYQQLPTFIISPEEIKLGFEKDIILAVPYINFYSKNKSFNDLYKLCNDSSLLNSSNRDEYTWEEIEKYHHQIIKGSKWFRKHHNYCVSKCNLSWVIILNIISEKKIMSSQLIGYAGIKKDDTFYIDVSLSDLYLNIIEKYQRKGIGTKFNQEFIKWWKKKFPNENLQWVSRFDNLGSQKLALNSGFVYKRKVNLECEYYVYELK